MLRAALRRWWWSSFLASFGDGLRLAAFPLLAAGITRSPTAIATVVAVQGVPWLLVGLVAGVLVDRRGPRWVLVMVQGLQVLAILGLAAAVVAGADNLALIAVCAFVTGVAAALRATAQQAGTPRLIDSDDLDRANGHLEAGSLIGNELLGPASSGVLFGIAAALPFAVNGGAIGLAVLLVLTVPGLGPRLASQADRRPVAAELGEGLGWVRRSPVIRTLIVAVGVVAVTDAAWFAVLVLYVTRVLHRSAGDYGALLAVGALGGIAAATACGALVLKVGAQRMLVFSVVVMAASQLVLGLVSDLLLAAVMLALSSGAFAIFNVVAVGMRQRFVPEALFGRVTSLYMAIAGGAEAVGALTGGVIASIAGIRAPMLLGVLPLLAVIGGLIATQRHSSSN